MTASSSAATLKAQLRHPIVDCDGHWQEALPVLLEYVRDVGGAKSVDDYLASMRTVEGTGTYLQLKRSITASEDDRIGNRLSKLTRYSIATTLDKATSMLPGLLFERLDDLGIDVAILYPTGGLAINLMGHTELRRTVARALNKMTADTFAPLQSRLIPVATIPVHSPDEAIEETEYAVKTLGFKAIAIHGCIPRPLPARRDGAFEGSFRQSSHLQPYYVDTLGLDNLSDYDAFWQKCVDLKVAITSHAGSLAWPDRRSVNNFTFNHIGHFAQANHTFARAVFLGGVIRRFPQLNFAFLEGGAGYAATLLFDLIAHWERMKPSAVLEYYNPANLDFAELRKLIMTYGSPVMQQKADEMVSGLPRDAIEPVDDFALAGIETKQDIIDAYTQNFYFGCEADDPVTPWAFDKRLGAKLRPVFSSDFGHIDVHVMAEVIAEVFELIEKGWVTEEDFRDFTFTNAVQLHGRLNPDFFKGTLVEDQARAVLNPTGQPVSTASR